MAGGVTPLLLFAMNPSPHMALSIEFDTVMTWFIAQIVGWSVPLTLGIAGACSCILASLLCLPLHFSYNHVTLAVSPDYSKRGTLVGGLVFNHSAAIAELLPKPQHGRTFLHSDPIAFDILNLVRGVHETL